MWALFLRGQVHAGFIDSAEVMFGHLLNEGETGKPTRLSGWHRLQTLVCMKVRFMHCSSKASCHISFMNMRCIPVFVKLVVARFLE